MNSSGTVEGTCESISQTPVSSNTIKKKISIEPNITHEYTVKVTFIDTGEPQNYNKNKSFNGKLGIEEYVPTQFEKDSWTAIVANVKANKISQYNVGDTKEVDMGTYGTHTLRIANTSTPSECSTSGFSQTACGFVLEFADIITKHNMNPSGTYKGTTYNYGWNKDGWPATSMRTFVNNDIYNALPSEIKNAIIDTTVVSGHGSTSGETNFTSTDKLYLLSPKEIYTDWSKSNDTAKDLTRTLDYYTSIGVTVNDKSGAIKKNGTSASYWWLRAAYSSDTVSFFRVYDSGGCGSNYAYGLIDVAPAFRLR